MCTVAHYSENIGIKDSDWERRRLKLIMFAAHMATFCGMSLMDVLQGMLQVTGDTM